MGIKPKHVEEISLQRRDMSLRLVINHSHGHARFMDYRVGKYPEKRDMLDRLARQLGLRKVFTLVEKQDSHNWRTVGFTREGTYPSFFRTADGYVMGRLYDEAGEPLPVNGPLKTAGNEQLQFPERKLRPPNGLRIETVDDEQSRSRVLDGPNEELRALPFCRAMVPDVLLHAKAQKREGWVCAEINESFGFATVSFAPCPAEEADLILSAYVGHSVFSTLKEKEVNNCFGLSPINDRWSNELFSGLGFKVTGRLADHLKTEAGYSTAFIWHKKLAADTIQPLPCS